MHYNAHIEETYYSLHLDLIDPTLPAHLRDHYLSVAIQCSLCLISDSIDCLKESKTPFSGE